MVTPMPAFHTGNLSKSPRVQRNEIEGGECRGAMVFEDVDEIQVSFRTDRIYVCHQRWAAKEDWRREKLPVGSTVRARLPRIGAHSSFASTSSIHSPCLHPPRFLHDRSITRRSSYRLNFASFHLHTAFRITRNRTIVLVARQDVAAPNIAYNVWVPSLCVRASCG